MTACAGAWRLSGILSVVPPLSPQYNLLPTKTEPNYSENVSLVAVGNKRKSESVRASMRKMMVGSMLANIRKWCFLCPNQTNPTAFKKRSSSATKRTHQLEPSCSNSQIDCSTFRFVVCDSVCVFFVPNPPSSFTDSLWAKRVQAPTWAVRRGKRGSGVSGVLSAFGAGRRAPPAR